MDVCLVNQEGELLLHRTMKAAPEPVLQAIAPYREGLVVAVECLLTWDWLADLWAHEGMAFVLGHARSMKAIHGGQATHATSDSHTMAVWLRGGRLPHADVDPAERRAPRDLLRRRSHLLRQRAARLAPVQQPNRQDHRPAIGQHIADKANRLGVAERLADRAVPQRIAVDFTLITSDDARRSGLAWSIVQSATPHEAKTVCRRRSIPGVGQLLALGRLDDIHAIRRFPRGQDGVSSGRLVTWAKASAGKRSGTSGTTRGHASRKWAFSDAAVLCLRHHPAGQQWLARVETTHRQGKALTILAHTRARAVYDLLQRDTVFALHKCLSPERSTTGEPGASRDPSRDAPAASVPAALCHGVCERPGTPRPGSPEPGALMGPPLGRLNRQRPVAHGGVGGPSPAPGTHGRVKNTQPALCRGRYEGTT